MQIVPTLDRVLVKRIEAETETPSGLVIPDSAQKKQAQGTVIATGPGKRNSDGAPIPMGFGVGSVVIFNKYSGTEVNEVEGLVIVTEDEILGIVTT